MSKSETSKATGRPVTRVPWRIVVEAGGKIVGDETEADSHKHPGGYTIRLHGANATVATVYRPGDAVTIRERVNGWEALVAERDRLLGALQAVYADAGASGMSDAARDRMLSALTGGAA